MSANPLVSIICTNFNKGEWIREAIESFLAQKTDFDFEIILVDDKSTDNSPEILREFAQKFPEKIRLFENEENLGITRTWKKICPEARGEFIARCDGDDFWTRNDKLQKQVEALRKNPNSGWCNTDFDIVDQDGNLVKENGFESGAIPLADNFSKMLATRGFTMSSTWLVKTDLMLAANKNLPDGAVDDTFNIQLELFQKTQLTYLPESTTIYRVNNGSDSRPVDDEKRRLRDGRLAKTQIEYFKKCNPDEKNEVFEKLVERWNLELDANELQRRDLDYQKSVLAHNQSEISKFEKKVAEMQELWQRDGDELRRIYSSRTYKIFRRMSNIINFLRRK